MHLEALNADKLQAEPEMRAGTSTNPVGKLFAAMALSMGGDTIEW